MFKLTLLLALVAAVWGAPSFNENSSDLGGRIVGGNETTIEDHPYIVSLQRSGGHICGGTIINSTWIVTAAHCVSAQASLFSVRAGSSVRNSLGQVVPAARIIIHEGYSWSTIDNDVALIELASPITHPVARAIGMSEGNKPPAGTIATITGWGALWEGGPSANVLQVVEVPIVSQADCRAAYSQSSVTDRMLCAGRLGVGGMDACQGDSGGPLITNGALTGIVSWGAGCARPDAPGVYASVPALRAWIRTNSGI